MIAKKLTFNGPILGYLPAEKNKIRKLGKMTKRCVETAFFCMKHMFDTGSTVMI
ncbi:hypothetical protein Cst_c11830 [Thermoclostridium stercorarium subsp. stercorarium DSM 8532]|uniref:Uncharacterized protein n=1 Tax=Thermoclostridium stercorarium (strain ATCC 35414 / DSM 8532 / NCIMB 11754) TaxID=1121335 RepID=L7VRK0_THES1|nr:hypothetical protein Cst_c11830 [Thermoclostridium stercorarium subsp. stercorarium DSM 8532]